MVCYRKAGGRNFDLRAHGIHHEFARKMERDILKQNRSTLSVEKDQQQTKEKEIIHPVVIKDWLRDYSQRFSEKSSTEKVIVLPYRNIKPVYEAYKADFQSDVSLKLQNQPLSDRQFGKLFNKYSIELNVLIQRDTTNFLSCSACDAYDARIRLKQTSNEIYSRLSSLGTLQNSRNSDLSITNIAERLWKTLSVTYPSL